MRLMLPSSASARRSSASTHQHWRASLGRRSGIFATLCFPFLLALLWPAVLAGGPQFWRFGSFAEVEKGEVVGLTVAANGEVTLAPDLTPLFETGEPYLWSMVADRAGTIYLGTGSPGKIYRLPATGGGSLLFTAPELSIMALAIDSAGTLYAASAPDGKVYRIAPNGEASLFFDPQAKYIWALTFDAAGHLLVATGERGLLYRVSPTGEGKVLATLPQANLTSLLVEPTGDLLVGTDPGGSLLRVSSNGRLFTLFDSPQREIRDLALAPDGTILALALAESAGMGAASGAATPSPSATPTVALPGEGTVTVTLSDVQVLDSGGASISSITPTPAGQSRSVLYRLSAEGAASVLWESADVAALAALPHPTDGSVLIGTGPRGHLFHAPADGPSSLLARLEVAQTSRLLRAGTNVYLATSSPSTLFRLGPMPSTRTFGTLTSPVRDARQHATWGRLDWTGDGPIEIQTRSGNTATPDSTWSDWSTPFPVAPGGPIASPPARYLQWRATLRRSPAGPAPTLREVVISYLPRNLAPRLTSLTLLPTGVALQALPQGASDNLPEALQAEAAAVTGTPQMPPRRLYQRGALSLQWQADDPNQDQLEFTVLYRPLDREDYLPLRTALRDPFYTIDPHTLPDGRYRFQVRVSDHLSNPPALALLHRLESEPVEIDLTPPLVRSLPVARTRDHLELRFEAADATSPLRRAEFQVDGGPWIPLYPVDGIADSPTESYLLRLPPHPTPRLVAVRVFDASSNVGSAQILISQ
jgi:hypothetical protein